MARVNPTRMELTRLKKRLKTAKYQGSKHIWPLTKSYIFSIFAVLWIGPTT